MKEKNLENEGERKSNLAAREGIFLSVANCNVRTFYLMRKEEEKCEVFFLSFDLVSRRQLPHVLQNHTYFPIHMKSLAAIWKMLLCSSRKMGAKCCCSVKYQSSFSCARMIKHRIKFLITVCVTWFGGSWVKPVRAGQLSYKAQKLNWMFAYKIFAC